MKINVKNLVLYIMLVFFPILPEYFRIGGYTVYQFIIVGAFLWTCVNGIKKSKLRFYSKYILPILLLSVVVNGYYKEYSSFISILITPVMAIFVIFMLLKDEEDCDNALKFLVVVGLFMGLTGFVEFISGYNIFSLVETADLGAMGPSAYYRNGMIRIEQSFGSAITFGLYMLFVNAIAFSMISISQGKQRKRYLLCYVITFPIVFLTGSRMPILTLVLLQVLFFMRSKMSKKVAVIIGLLFILFFDLVNGGVLYTYISKYSSLVVQLFSGDTTDTSSSYRLALIPTLIPYIKNKFWLGYGNSFMNNFTFMYDGHSHYSIDNGYLSNLMAHGVLGLLRTLWPMLCGCVLATKMLKRKDKRGYYFLSMYIVYLMNIFSVAQMGERKICFTLVAVQMAYEYFEIKKKQNEKMQGYIS